MKKLSFLLLILGFIFSSTAFAGVSYSIWSNQSGVQTASHCRLSDMKQSLPPALSKYADQVVEVLDIAPSVQPSMMTAELKGSYMLIATKDGIPQQMTCDEFPNKTYIAFDVYSPSEDKNLWQMGVSTSDLEVFHHSQILSREQMEELFSPDELNEIDEKSTLIADDMEQVICSLSADNNIYSDDLNQAIFSVKSAEQVQAMQSWGTNKKSKIVNGKNISFIKVLFPQLDDNQNIGWVEESLVTPASKCSVDSHRNLMSKAILATESVAATSSGWKFPTVKRPTISYKTGMRAFKSKRSGGKRLHAACDLYRTKGEAAIAINAGKVVRGLYFFYQGTYALEVRHSDGKIARYGEVTGKVASKTKKGSSVIAGQVVGYVGKVNSGCCKPMLHFELYSGKGKGALSQSGNKFQRRSDLINPTSYLTDWEKVQFGVSY